MSGGASPLLMGLGHRQVIVASARAVNNTFIIIVLLPLLTAKAVARAEVIPPGHVAMGHIQRSAWTWTS